MDGKMTEWRRCDGTWTVRKRRRRRGVANRTKGTRPLIGT